MVRGPSRAEAAARRGAAGASGSAAEGTVKKEEAGSVAVGIAGDGSKETSEALELPVAEDDVQVSREGLRTTASAAYTDSVEVFPNYKYPIRFQFTVQGINMGAGVSGGPNPLVNR